MFKYTKAALSLVIDNLKLYAKIFKYSSLIFSLAYYIYSLVTETGNTIVNIILISLIGTYIIFETITFNKNLKLTKKIVNKSFRWIRLALKAFTLASTIYSVYLTSTHVNAIRIILTTLLLAVFIIQVIIEIVTIIVEHNAKFIIEGFAQDMQDIKKPVNDIKNVIRRIKGEEIIENTPKSKKVLKLEKRIQKIKEKERKGN